MACGCRGSAQNQAQVAKTQAIAEKRTNIREERAKQQARENAKK